MTSAAAAYATAAARGPIVCTCTGSSTSACERECAALRRPPAARSALLRPRAFFLTFAPGRRTYSLPALSLNASTVPRLPILVLHPAGPPRCTKANLVRSTAGQPRPSSGQRSFVRNSAIIASVQNPVPQYGSLTLVRSSAIDPPAEHTTARYAKLQRRPARGLCRVCRNCGGACTRARSFKRSVIIV